MSALARTQKTKAEAFLADADKLLQKTSSTWGRLFTSKERTLEEAVEYIEQAANAYKVGGWHQEAGDAYSRAAKIHRDELKNYNDASKCLSNAGSCYKKSNPSDAVAAYHAAVTLLTDAGRLNQAAKLSKECGELFETEEIGGNDGDDGSGKSSIVLAIESYEQAAELFGLDDAKSAASSCLAKVAELCSAALDPPDLTRAAKIYDDLGRRCLDSNLLKFNAKGYFLQAILCHLAQPDAVGAAQALQKYEGLDYTFGESREGKFARQLLECVEGFDAEGFATACFEFDRISKLDPWKTSMLVKVKKSLEDEGGGAGGDDDVDLT